jgi:Flp pilus assembly protein TadD
MAFLLQLVLATSIEHMIAAGHYRTALEALAKEPASARRHVLASKAWDGLGDASKAVEEAEAALALEPGGEAAHLQLGQIFLSHNTPEAALEVFTGAQTLLPDSLLIRLGRGLALKELQRWDEAEAALSGCLPNAVAFDALATVYLHRNKFEAARDGARRYLEGAPQDWRGYYFLGAALDGLRGDPAEVRKLALMAIGKRADLAAAHALLGKVFLREGDAARAASALERAIQLRPDLSQAHLQLAQTYQKLGRTAEAQREFATVRRLKEEEAKPRQKLRYGRGKKEGAAAKN